MLDYEYIKRLYKLKPVDLSRKKEFGADPNTINQRELVRKLKKLDGNGNATDADADQTMFVLTISEKN